MKLLQNPESSEDPNVEYLSEKEFNDFVNKHKRKEKTELEILCQMEKVQVIDGGPPPVIRSNNVRTELKVSDYYSESKGRVKSKILEFKGRVDFPYNPDLFEYRLYAFRKDIYNNINLYMNHIDPFWKAFQ